METHNGNLKKRRVMYNLTNRIKYIIRTIKVNKFRKKDNSLCMNSFYNDNRLTDSRIYEELQDGNK